MTMTHNEFEDIKCQESYSVWTSHGALRNRSAHIDVTDDENRKPRFRCQGTVALLHGCIQITCQHAEIIWRVPTNDKIRDFHYSKPRVSLFRFAEILKTRRFFTGTRASSQTWIINLTTRRLLQIPALNEFHRKVKSLRRHKKLAVTTMKVFNDLCVTEGNLRFNARNNRIKVHGRY